MFTQSKDTLSDDEIFDEIMICHKQKQERQIHYVTPISPPESLYQNNQDLSLGNFEEGGGIP